MQELKRQVKRLEAKGLDKRRAIKLIAGAIGKTEKEVREVLR